MTEQEYISKIHYEILQVMDLIHNLCINNNLKYYLTGGTLLGAIRHKGFIPWDDDLDIAMPREDFNRFMKICETNLPVGYYLKYIMTSIDYEHCFSKICKDNTLFSESTGQWKTNYGIFVDIFPLDETSGATEIVSLRQKLTGKILNMIREKNRPGSMAGYKRYIVKFFSRKFLLQAINYAMCMSNNKGKRYYTNFASQYSVERKTQPKTVYGKGLLAPFEDRFYMVPDNYHADLLANFGPKYIELPPFEKRRTHYPAKVIFTDGSVFVPDKVNEQKVTVEESINW